MEIYHQYVKLRKHFGKWPKVIDEGAEMIADIRPNEEHAAAYIERSPVTTCTQVRFAPPCMSKTISCSDGHKPVCAGFAMASAYSSMLAHSRPKPRCSSQ
jgi:hypothetical protein